PMLVKKFQAEEIIIAIPSAPGNVIRDLVDICRRTPAKLKIVPKLYEIIEGRISVSSLREVEVEDLLCRQPVKVDLDEITGYLGGKCVLVTGAGGSIGSELSRQVACHNPATLVLLGHDENPIFDIEQELRRVFPQLNLKSVICDVKDKAKVNTVFKQYKPQVVFHAAAHKHVPLMEENPEEAIKNNILGTRNVAVAADQYGAGVFVFISTDKAVNPTSVMGTTKRIAEMVVQAMARKSTTKFAAVRFGNVLGSRGSVLPTFKEQIARGGPLTVTHKEMVRYFMTIPEAVQLVIQAGAMTRGGEIFVLDMGEPVKILHMAEDLIRLTGLEPYKDIDIKITGIRPGEKLYEELLTDEEGTTATKHKKIFISKNNDVDTEKLEEYIILFAARNWADNREELLVMLKDLVPAYQLENSLRTG
ncbi:MAG TPA: nucleoside-diphosphate sugar epimerase/dehydratase, partial [Clostridia bacterium]|nr:nucleoside-diphosphate sugar epimerase/dehydratase [Clostridia bacterium]